MKAKRHHLLATITGLLLCLVLLVPAVQAKQTLQFSASAQINDTLGQKALNAFTAQSGIAVDLYVSTSEAAVYRLMNEFSDLAASVRPLYYRHKESGYVEIPFCNDPLAVITNTTCNIDNLTEAQLRGIFSKTITNWKAVGGPDKPITVIVPGKGTAAYKNFDSLAMKRSEILYDYMSYQSTRVIEAVQQLPYSISFIGQGATAAQDGLRIVKINDVAPRDASYPYMQTFYFVTKGNPAGAAKKFIDFIRSDKGLSLLKETGVMPIAQ
ncbi:MAG: substrate-binding domain-containing protein [Desulfobacterales bacterium]|nr:substrate-binding domain-containing protein [Desulfobacterales bacterium]